MREAILKHYKHRYHVGREWGLCEAVELIVVIQNVDGRVKVVAVEPRALGVHGSQAANYCNLRQVTAAVAVLQVQGGRHSDESQVEGEVALVEKRV